ncbi:hypothetical protein M569_11426, partial [Genlisea aurea]
NSGEESSGAVGQQRKRGRYRRQTPEQIQELENFYTNYPHPSKSQREELSQKLHMEPMKVKFWFQNKRTQMKVKYGKEENIRLRVENEKIHIENTMLREALSSARCSECGAVSSTSNMTDEERNLRIENDRLKVEISRISAMAAQYVGKTFDEEETPLPPP